MCKPVNLTGQSGVFSSKNFPELYDAITDCKWNIKVAKNKKVKLTFHMIDVSVFVILKSTCMLVLMYIVKYIIYRTNVSTNSGLFLTTSFGSRS